MLLCVCQCDGDKMSLGAHVHWPLLPENEEANFCADDSKTTGYKWQPEQDGKEDPERKWPGIRKGVGGVTAHTEDIDKGRKSMSLRAPVSNENLGGLREVTQARRDPRG